MRMLKRSFPTISLLTSAVLLVFLGLSESRGKADKRDPFTLQPLHIKALKARSIGPAVMGGRVSSIALDPQDPFTFYVGLGTGGIMKTSTNGASFDAIFAKETVAAVGAISI